MSKGEIILLVAVALAVVAAIDWLMYRRSAHPFTLLRRLDRVEREAAERAVKLERRMDAIEARDREDRRVAAQAVRSLHAKIDALQANVIDLRNWAQNNVAAQLLEIRHRLEGADADPHPDRGT